jgi:hypothetical protein
VGILEILAGYSNKLKVELLHFLPLLRSWSFSNIFMFINNNNNNDKKNSDIYIYLCFFIDNNILVSDI